jgi:hypothetical protein
MNPAPRTLRTLLAACLVLLGAVALAGCTAGSATTHLEVHFAGKADDVSADVRSDLSSRPTAERYKADRIPHPDGYSAHDQLEDWAKQEKGAYTATAFNSSFGAGYFLDSISGVATDGASAYWALAINGLVSDVGMSEALLKDGDVVTWTYTAVASGGNTTATDLLTLDPVQPTQQDAVTLTGQVARDATVSIRNGPSVQAAKGAWTLKVPLAAYGQTRATLVADDGKATQAVDLVLVRLASATFETKYTAYPAHDDGSDTVWFDPSVRASLPMYDGKAAPRSDQYSVHDLMVDWTAQTGTAIEYGYSESFGFSVSKIDGVGQPVDASLPPYWCYKVDGQTADFGISLQPLLPGQTVTWEYAGCM